MVTLYKRSSNGKPLIWMIYRDGDTIITKYGLVGGNLHLETINPTMVKANEVQSRINVKRKEGYKEINELKDSGLVDESVFKTLLIQDQIRYLNTYLPKYSTTEEGFVLPMLAKVIEDNKPFDKYGAMLGQYKIDGLRCIIGAEKTDDMFNPIRLTYHSRTGENWTSNMAWMDDVILPKLDGELLDMMIEEGAYLDGELYLPNNPVNLINSFVKNTTLPQHYKLQYWCYDICCENMSAAVRDYKRQQLIHTRIYHFADKEQHLNNENPFILLPTNNCIANINDAIAIRDRYINLGFEGLILRNPVSEYQFGKRNQAMFKFKKVDDGKFVIVDIKSEHKRSDLPLFVLRNDINYELFECSINASHDTQRNILINKDKYIDKYAVVEFRNRSGVAQVPFHARIVKIE